jgi:hypothetical protein
MPWSALESLPLLDTHPVIWRGLTREHFPAFKRLCLRPSPPFPDSYPCPRNCGCYHEIILPPGTFASPSPRGEGRGEGEFSGPSSIIHHPPSTIRAACRCKPPACPDLILTIEDITCLKVDRPKLGRAIARALLLDPKWAELPPTSTAQIGTWSTQAIPVILTIHNDDRCLQSAVAQLAATIDRPFILLAPTARQLNANGLAFLSRQHAAFFPLASILTLQPDGTLAPTRPPAEIFAQFTAPPPSIIHPARQPSTFNLQPSTRYALRKGLGLWHLIFDSKEAILKHERGLFYVAWLLYHPDETPIHALDLMAKIPEIYRQQLGLTQLTDPTTGKVVPLQSGARLQERSLALDDRQAMRALYRKQQELEALLDSTDATEPEKAEALRELEAIYTYQRQNASRSRDAAQKAVRTVRMAIKRLHQHLLTATSSDGASDPVLRSFADHLQKNLILPSARYSTHASSGPRRSLSGSFTYDRPTAFSWLP